VDSGKTCEDALHYQLINSEFGETIVCFISDGAGSAKYASKASETSVQQSVDFVIDLLNKNTIVNNNSLLQLAEKVYDTLSGFATQLNEPLNEFSCTLLGFIISPDRACFLQIGDGAIVRNDGSNYFTPIWWPHNGEYQNTTAFLIDDPNFKNLKIKIIEEPIYEVAIFTDGLQMLSLNNETQSVHQPFFNNLFKWLRKATDDDHISILNNKLIEYLSGEIINSRTDDDKTLLLATKLNHDNLVI
jgi:hypothetical protein